MINIKIGKDGDKFHVLEGENMQEGISGFGETEIEAFINYLIERDKITSKNWRAKKMGTYWFYNQNTQEESCRVEDRFEMAELHYNIGNYFKTQQEAIDYQKKLLAIGKITRAINELNDGWEPDWSRDSQPKHCLFWSGNNKRFVVDFSRVNIHAFQVPFMRSINIANQIIKDYEPELRIIFNVK